MFDMHAINFEFGFGRMLLLFFHLWDEWL